ncbi:MAG: WD40/YVTN/BNR-like repeat-containing protein [Ignavibacteriaceae bacterium]
MKKLLQSLFIIISFILYTVEVNAQWVQTNGPYGGIIYALAVSNNGTGGTNLFAGSDSWGGGVFLSTNNGTSWTPVNTGLPTIKIVQTLAINGTNIFAGLNGGGVFLSTNTGKAGMQSILDCQLMNQL